jgi:hypothetical protein
LIEADKKETIIVGYAFLEDESEEERAALQRRLEKTFGTDHLLYLAGDKEDVENAKKAEPTEEIDSYEMESEDDSTESEGEESEISGEADE